MALKQEEAKFEKQVNVVFFPRLLLFQLLSSVLPALKSSSK